MAAANSSNANEKQALRLYGEFEFASGVLLLFLSTIGVASNSLLLVSIWKNPMKSFRSPTTNFIIGLAVADLLTGLTTEPFFSLYYFVRYYSTPESDISSFKMVFKIGGVISTITVSSSFVIVLALSCSQYIAIEFPHKYKALVTNKRALTIVLSSWVYFICFGFLQFADIDEELYYKIHLATHSSLVSLILLIILVLLYRSFQSNLAHRTPAVIRNPNASRESAQASKHQGNGKRWGVNLTIRNPLLATRNGNADSPINSIMSDEAIDKTVSLVSETGCTENAFVRANMLRKSQRKVTIERQLTYVTFYLAAILLISALPHVILAQIFLYKQETLSNKEKLDFRIALLVSDIFLLLKVGLDPFVYAWRLPSYRQALRDTIQRCCRRKLLTAPRLNTLNLSSNKI